MDKSKVLLACTAIVFSFGIATSSLANGRFVSPPPPPPCPKSCLDGGYIGAGGGVVHVWPDVDNSYRVYFEGHPPNSGFGKGYNFKFGEYGFNANIFAGYGKEFSTPYYFGVEAFANYFSPKVKGSRYSYVTEDLSTNIEVKNAYSFGGDIRVGYIILPKTMLYVLFGVDYAKFNGRSDVIYLFNPEYSIINKFDKWKMGYMPGIGMETCLNDRISLRVQYSYTFYDSLNFNTYHKYTSIYQTYPIIVSLKTKVSPHRDMVTLMFAFK